MSEGYGVTPFGISAFCFFNARIWERDQMRAFVFLQGCIFFSNFVTETNK